MKSSPPGVCVCVCARAKNVKVHRIFVEIECLLVHLDCFHSSLVSLEFKVQEVARRLNKGNIL